MNISLLLIGFSPASVNISVGQPERFILLIFAPFGAVSLSCLLIVSEGRTKRLAMLRAHILLYVGVCFMCFAFQLLFYIKYALL